MILVPPIFPLSVVPSEYLAEKVPVDVLPLKCDVVRVVICRPFLATLSLGPVMTLFSQVPTARAGPSRNRRSLLPRRLRSVDFTNAPETFPGAFFCVLQRIATGPHVRLQDPHARCRRRPMGR